MRARVGRAAGMVVGTAGHIDHGKTALIGALTGIDTDRLAEEKQRGISIDLGFAHLTFADGRRIAFVDVPGHERFIRNMLAGAGGVEAVLLVVAADESVKPQTREHYEICRLLGIERGLVVLSKADLASTEQLAATRAAVADLTAGSFLSNAPVIPVSAMTGEGMDRLRRALEELSRIDTARDADGLARLPIDRAFSLKGFGTVVTGTLWSGSLRVGDTVEIQTGGREAGRGETDSHEARIRGLQVHGDPVQTAQAGQRIAVNLSGVDHSEVRRGHVLTNPKSIGPTNSFQGSLDWLSEVEAPQPGENYLLHIGTSEVPARVKVLGPQPGQHGAGRHESFVQLNLPEAVLALPGDRFILRRPSPSLTVGGGVVIDAFPPRKLSRGKAVLRLERLAGQDFEGRLQTMVDEKEDGREISELVRLTGRTHEQVKAAIARSTGLLPIEAGDVVVSRAWVERRRQLLTGFLSAFHREHPSLPGAPISRARLGLPAVLANFVMADFAAVRVAGDLIALTGHRAQVSPVEVAALLKVEQAFRAAGYQPPNPGEILKQVTPDGKTGRGLLEQLIKSGRLVRISDELVFHTEVITHLRRSLLPHKGRRFSIPEFKQWTQISRKYAVPLLEFLDGQRVTKREGDNRIVL